MTGNEINYYGHIIKNYLYCGAHVFTVTHAAANVSFSSLQEAKDYVDSLLDQKGANS